MTKSSRTNNAVGTVPRRSQVANACMTCRGNKVKCSGKRPTCSRCHSRGLHCEYDVSEEGVTKRQRLHQELSEQRQELDRSAAVLDVLRHGSDEEATATLARLRLGLSLNDVFAWIESRSLQKQEQQQDRQCATTPLSVQESPVPAELLSQQGHGEQFPENSVSGYGHPTQQPQMDSLRWGHPHPNINFKQSISSQGTDWKGQSMAEDAEHMAWSQLVSPIDAGMSTYVDTQNFYESQTAWAQRYHEAPGTHDMI